MSAIDLTQFDGHTPGPWHECDHHGRRWIETAGDVAVAQIVRTGIRSETVANSALIKAAPELLAEVRRLTAEADAARCERDELAAQVHIVTSERDELASGMQALRARLAEIERAEPVAWVPVHPREGALWSMTTAAPSDERLPSHYPLSPLYTSPAPAAAPELAEPADPRTPPPGFRLLGDYEPAQAGDMAYIGGIGGTWRPVRRRMGIIGATMDELSNGARVLALARPCRCGPDRVSCQKGGAK